MVAAGNDNLFRRLCGAIGRPGLAEEARFRSNPERVVNRRELIPILTDIFRTVPMAVWAERLDQAGIPNSPIQTLDRVVSDAQTAALGIIQQWAGSPALSLVGLPVSFDGARPAFAKTAPRLGEDNTESCRSGSMSFRRRSLFAVPLGVALASCATVAPPQPATGTRVAEAREDSSHRFIMFIGPKTQHAPPFLGVPETNFYCLRSFVDRRTDETAHQLYVTDSYFGAERGWNAARDNAGSPLPFIAIGHDEISCDAGCSYVEEFAAELPESALRASPDGFAVTFSSRSGDEKTIAIPAQRVTAQLTAIDAKRGPMQPAVAGSAPGANRSAAH